MDVVVVVGDVVLVVVGSGWVDVVDVLVVAVVLVVGDVVLVVVEASGWVDVVEVDVLVVAVVLVVDDVVLVVVVDGCVDVVDVVLLVVVVVEQPESGVAVQLDVPLHARTVHRSLVQVMPVPTQTPLPSQVSL